MKRFEKKGPCCSPCRAVLHISMREIKRWRQVQLRHEADDSARHFWQFVDKSAILPNSVVVLASSVTFKWVLLARDRCKIISHTAGDKRAKKSKPYATFENAGIFYSFVKKRAFKTFLLYSRFFKMHNQSLMAFECQRSKFQEILNDLMEKNWPRPCRSQILYAGRDEANPRLFLYSRVSFVADRPSLRSSADSFTEIWQGHLQKLSLFQNRKSEQKRMNVSPIFAYITENPLKFM